jgi:hypothetical protein
MAFLVSQGWPEELPFLVEKQLTSNSSTNASSTMELDTGVIFYGFSFAVICLFILVQVEKSSVGHGVVT